MKTNRQTHTSTYALTFSAIGTFTY